MESTKARGVYVEPLAPYHVRKREQATAYMREFRQREKEGKTATSPTR